MWLPLGLGLVSIVALVAALRPSLLTLSIWSTPTVTAMSTSEEGSGTEPVSSPVVPLPSEAKHWTRHFDHSLRKEMGWLSETWGSLRPNVYFGMKTKSVPFALSTGLMWSGSRGVFGGIRHDTAQGELTKFEWLEHDGRSYGLESLVDGDHELDIRASFAVVVAASGADKDPGAVWVQRIVARPTQSQQQGQGDATVLALYLGVEGADTSSTGVQRMLREANVRIERVVQHPGHGTALTVLGTSQKFGSFSLSVSAREEEGGSVCPGGADATCQVLGLSCSALAEADVSRGVERTQLLLRSRRAADGAGAIEPSASFLSVVATGSSSITLDVVMRSHGADSLDTMLHWAQSGQHLSTQTASVDAWLADGSNRFHSRFNEAFPLSQDENFTAKDVDAAKATLSSLLGGMGFFHGVPRLGDAIDVSTSSSSTAAEAGKALEEPAVAVPEPISLLSATPSRTAFPRGFLWDEGFHQLLVVQWDAALTAEVLAHWLDAMYKCSEPEAEAAGVGGWIPREMILGDSATRRVPDEFVTQRVNIANPPTLLLAVQSLMRRAGSLGAEERQTVLSFLSKAYPALHEWVQWFLHSQRGTGESFRWRGRSSSDQKVIPNTLASGLDDYPRAPLPHEHERHLDLHCWMVLACDVMTQLGALLDESPLPVKTATAAVKFEYAAKAATLRAALDEMHWSEQLQAYADVGVSGSKDQLRGEVLFRCGHPTDPTAAVDVSVPVEVVKSGAAFCPESHPKPLFPHGDGNGQVRVRERYVVQGELSLQYIPRLGYVNLFPLLLRVLDAQSPRLSALLALLETPSLLWSDHGLRSLSTTDAFYRRNNAPGDAPYWRCVLPASLFPLSIFYSPFITPPHSLAHLAFPSLPYAQRPHLDKRQLSGPRRPSALQPAARAAAGALHQALPRPSRQRLAHRAWRVPPHGLPMGAVRRQGGCGHSRTSL